MQIKQFNLRVGSAAVSMLLAISIGIQSCNDEPTNLVYLAETVVPGGYCLPVTVCDNPGNNCAKRGVQFFRSDTEDTRPKTFYRLAAHDSAAYFFQNYYWEDLFPHLEQRSGIVNNIINGNYTVRVLGDSSIVILSGRELSQQNIVFAYDYDARVICDVQ
jgi:hypothetical protein